MIEPDRPNGSEAPAESPPDAPPPASAARRELELVVGERRYVLVESMNAYCRMEAIAAATTAAIVMEAAQGGMRATRALLWAHLQSKHGDEFTTLEAVGDVIDRVGIDTVWRQLQLLAGLEPAAEKVSRQVRRARARGAA